MHELQYIETPNVLLLFSQFYCNKLLSIEQNRRMNLYCVSAGWKDWCVPAVPGHSLSNADQAHGGGHL